MGKVILNSILTAGGVKQSGSGHLETEMWDKELETGTIDGTEAAPVAIIARTLTTMREGACLTSIANKNYDETDRTWRTGDFEQCDTDTLGLYIPRQRYRYKTGCMRLERNSDKTGRMDMELLHTMDVALIPASTWRWSFKETATDTMHTDRVQDTSLQLTMKLQGNCDRYHACRRGSGSSQRSRPSWLQLHHQTPGKTITVVFDSVNWLLFQNLMLGQHSSILHQYFKHTKSCEAQSHALLLLLI
jgi:hypothetical protein